MRGRNRTTAETREEWLKCSASFPYWCNRWVQVYGAAPASAGGAGAWLPFRLWPAQADVAAVLQSERLVVMLKARQLGMSWLVTAYALWLMVFRPAASVLLFSKRDVGGSAPVGVPVARHVHAAAPSDAGAGGTGG